MPSPPSPDPQDLNRTFQGLLRQDAWEVEADPQPEPPPAKPTAAQRASASEPPPLVRIVEAMLFLGGVPLTCERAAEVIRGLTADQLEESIDGLNRAYRSQARPYSIVKQEGGFALELRRSFRHVVEKLAGGMREARLSTAAVEALAVVVYRQPVTKQEVETLRGHESGALLRQLLRRSLITVVSRAESGGRDVQYGTTGRFLEVFGLKSLDDLPQTEDLQRL